MSFLEVRDLTVTYPTIRGRFQAVAGVDFDLERGQTLGLVGESGSGKSSIARALVGLTPAAGRVTLDGTPLLKAGRHLRRRVQIVFQDPYSSLNPRLAVGDAIDEALQQAGMPRGQNRRREVTHLLGLVGLEADAAKRFPHEFSGGQRQRIAIARSLAMRPDVLIADEPTSALDVSVQASILNLLREIQARTGTALLLVSHNLAVVRYMSDTVAVMYLGRLVELAPVGELFQHPQHPYTRALLESVPRLGTRLPLRALEGEIPDAMRPPSGCRFRTRCSISRLPDPCATDVPVLIEHGRSGHRCACHLAEDSGRSMAS